VVHVYEELSVLASRGRPSARAGSLASIESIYSSPAQRAFVTSGPSGLSAGPVVHVSTQKSP